LSEPKAVFFTKPADVQKPLVKRFAFTGEPPEATEIFVALGR